MVTPAVASLVLSVLRFVTETITGQARSKQESIDKVFKSVVEKSYLDLQTIHEDYSTNLSKLRDHLVEGTMPPRELIRWLRDTGLKHRADREKLATIEEEIRHLEGKFDPQKNQEDNFYWHLHGYIKSILRYYEACISHSQFSFYRDYEQSLNTLLMGIETAHAQDNPAIAEAVKKVFYESDYVQDTNGQLVRISDKVLPERWREVSREYRSVRAAAGYPN